MGRPRTNGKNAAQIATEAAACYDRRLKGQSIRAIADAVGLPKTTVQERLDLYITDLVMPLADEVRLLELERLDSWAAKLEDQLGNGEAPERIVPVLLRVQERRARLLGLDAPERAEVSIPQLPADDATTAILAAARARAEERLATIREGREKESVAPSLSPTARP